jgi:AcrR family transcriptional regulator
MAKQKKIEVDLSTEEKIREAAKKVFTQKGYAATRTRDIAEEAGINLALLNYYFRSKEKLFHLVMEEKMQQLFGILFPIINDEKSGLQVKLELITASYIDLLSKNPDLPIFVLSEIKNSEGGFLKQLPVKKMLRESVMVRQFQEFRSDISPLHFIMNLLGMIIFPFVGSPVFKGTGVVDDQIFRQMMDDRKKMIPLWMKTLLETK